MGKETKERKDKKTRHGIKQRDSLRPQNPIDREGGVGLRTRVTPARQSEG